MLSAWTGVVLVLCLTPVSGDSSGAPGLCLFCGERAARNLVGNIALFLPIGFALRRSAGTTGLVVLAGFLLSFGIELAQLFVPGRFPALGDLLANTAGAWAGGALGTSPRVWILPDGGARVRLQALWAGGVATLTLVTGLLLVPSVPAGVFFGNWTPEVGNLAPYPGELYSASLGDYALPSQRLEDPGRVQRALGANEPLSLEFLVGPAPVRRAPLFRLIGEGQREVIRIDVQGTTVVVGPRYQATRLTLSRPELRFRSAMAGLEPGDTVSLTLRRGPGGGSELQIDDRVALEGFTPTRGWVVLSDLDNVSPGVTRVFDMLWGLALFFPIGWWSATFVGLAAAAVPVLAVVAITPAVTPLLGSPPGHLLVAAGFAVAGYLLSRSARARRAPHALQRPEPPAATTPS